MILLCTYIRFGVEDQPITVPEFTLTHTITETPIRPLVPAQHHWHTGVTSKHIPDSPTTLLGQQETTL